MYLVEFNIAIECDEWGHNSYDKESEMGRTNTITNELNCYWVRFNPHAKDFNIGDVIADILQIIDFKKLSRNQLIH